MSKTVGVFVIAAIVVILILGSLFGLWYKGGSELSSVYIDINTMKQSPAAPRLLYRGIKVPGTDGSVVLFKRYHRIVVKEPYTGLMTSVLYNSDGYNQFFMFYENGQIAAKGLCLVETQELDGQIFHNTDDVKEAEYYSPERRLVSAVKDGTGVITIHFSDGSKCWELELENYRRKSNKFWLKDGTLKLDKTY